MVSLLSTLIFFGLIGLLLWRLLEMMWRNPDQPSRD